MGFGWGIVVGLAGVVALAQVLGRFMGFSAQRAVRYAPTEPEFDLRKHLDGPMICEGVVYGPLGRVTSRFVATMEGRWQGDSGVLDEEFHFDTGTIQHRRWNLTLLPGGRFSATAEDIIGQMQGEVGGAAAGMRYRLRLSEKAGGHVLDVRDWMYLLHNGTIMNRSQMRKFGIKVAELVAVIRKP